MGTSAGRIHAQIEALEQSLTNTALGYWCRLRKMLEADEVAVDDDERNRGVRCELVRCGLIQLVSEGIVCPLLDQLRRLRAGWKRRKEKSRNIRQAEAAQMMLFEPESELPDAVPSTGGTSPQTSRQRRDAKPRKPRQRGLIRRVRRWEAERRDAVKVAAPPQTPPIERNTASSCARRDEPVIPREKLSPQAAEFLDSRSLRALPKTVANLETLVAEGGWERAAELTDEGMANGAMWPVGWALGKARKQAKWGKPREGPRKPRHSWVQANLERNRENHRIAQERARARAEAAA